MTMSILHTVIINTHDMQGLADFYGPGLQLGEPQAHDDNHLGWQLPNLYFGFDLVTGAYTYPGAISLWFEVDDLDGTYQRLLSLGGTSKYGPTTKPWGAKLAAVFDPDGNVLGLAQRGTA